MDNDIKRLLGDGALPDEIVSALQEAFDKKVAAASEQAQINAREEMAARYEQDKAALVEAVDRMVTDALNKQAEATHKQNESLKGARRAFREAKGKMLSVYRSKLSETQEASRSVVSAKLASEVKRLREAQRKLTAEQLRVADVLEAEKARLAEDHAARVRKIDEFVVRQTAKELKELNEDHKALVQQRVKLVREGKSKLREAQARFVKQAAQRVEGAIDAALSREMKQLHEDLERNRQNMFGRRIFEAVAAEYLSSYLAEGTEIRKLQKVVETKEKELSDVKARLDETTKANEIAARKAKIAEDRAQRTKIVSELLSNLRGDKRSVMEGMLETVKTEQLRETFNRLLPVVLSEGTGRKPVPSVSTQQRRPLSETRPAGTVVTGDRGRTNRLFEASNAEAAEFDNEVAQVVRLAGLVK